MTPELVNDEQWVLPKRLRQGIREALSGKHGRLRMDPQDLGELIGKAIDMEVERLARIRAEHENQSRIMRMLRSAEFYIAPNGHRAGPARSSSTRKNSRGSTSDEGGFVSIDPFFRREPWLRR